MSERNLRLKALQALQILDTSPEKEFDNLTQLAAQICGVPISLISFLDGERVFYKSHHGIKISETSLKNSFCTQAIKNPGQLFEIEDARKDDRFKGHVLIGDKHKVAFYAGVPLVTPDGHALGTICVLDRKPGKLKKAQAEALKALGHQVVQLLELRKSRNARDTAPTSLKVEVQRLENIIEATQTGTWEWNVQTGEVRINERWAEIIGYTKKELEPINIDMWYRVVHPDDRDRTDRDLQACFDKKATFYDTDCRMIHKDGHEVWINDRGRVISWTEDGKPLWMVGMHTDITAKKNAENQLHTISDNIPGAVFRFRLSPDGTDRLELVSNGASELWGCSPEEVMRDNRVVWENFDKGDLEKVRNSIRQSAKHLSHWAMEWRYHHPDGTVRWHKGSGKPKRTEEGGTVWDAIILDITKRKRAEDERDTTLLALEERVKERTVLYEIANLSNYEFTIDQLLQKAVSLIAPGWRFPDITGVSISFGKSTFKTARFKNTKWKQTVQRESSSGEILEIKVVYLKKMPGEDDGPFLPEEWQLLNNIADNLIINVNHIAAKRELQIRENRFRALVENGADAVAILNIDGSASYISPSVTRVLGYSDKEALKLNLWEIIHPDDQPIVGANMAEALKNPGVPVEGPASRIRHKTGSWRFIEATVTNLLHDPAVNGIVDNFRDVTDRVNFENSLKASEEKYRSLFDASPLPMWIYDIDTGGIVDVNQTAVEKYGYSRTEFLQLHIIDLRPDSEIPRLTEAAKDVKELKGTKRFGVFLHQKKNGETMKMDISGHRIEIDNKDGLLVVCNDVTEREAAFEALLASEARIRGLYDSQTTFILRTDMKGRYTYVNSKFEKEFGWLYPDGKIVGKDSMNSILEYHHQRVGEVVEQCVLSPGKAFKIEIDKPTPHGGYVTTLWDFVCLADEMGVPSEIQCVGLDITDRIKSERALMQSNERYELVNRATNDAIYDWDVKNDHFVWGEGFYRIFNYKNEFETFRLEDWVKLMHPGDAALHEKDWEDFLASENQQKWVRDFRFRRADGSYAFVEEIGYMIRDEHGKPERMIGVLRDHTPFKLAEMQKDILREVAQVFKESGSLPETLSNVLRYLARTGKFKVAEIWLTSNNNKHLNLTSHFAKTKPAQAFYAAEDQVTRMKKGEGLPGAVWKRNRVLSWNDIQSQKAFIRKTAAAKAGLHAMVGIPLTHNNELIGVLMLGSGKPNFETETHFEMVHAIGPVLGAEIKRKKQEEEFQLFFDYAPEILAVADTEGRFTKVNPAFTEILGYSEQELLSTPIVDLIHPDDQETTLDEYEKNVSGEHLTDNFVNRYRAKDGSFRWLSWKSSQPFGDEGQFFAYGRDITEIVELQQLLENATRLARVGSWEVNLPKNEVYWSDMTKQIHEVDEDYVPNVKDGINFYKEGWSREKIADAIDNAINNGEPFDLELILVTAKGNERWIRTIGRAEFFEGECITVRGSFQDIDKRKKSELALQKAYEDRNNILESIGDGFFAVDNDFTVNYWNNHAEELLKVSKDTVLGKHLWNVFEGDDNPTSFDNYNRALREQQVVHFEDYYEKIDRWFEINVYPSGKGLSVFFKDITEQKKAEDDLHNRTRQLNALASINSRLINYEDWHRVIDESFAQIAEVVNADRVYYFKNGIDETTGGQVTSQVLEWTRDNVEPQIDNSEMQDVPVEMAEEFFEPLRKNLPYQGLTKNVKNDFLREILIEQDIKAVLCLPIIVNKTFWGFIGFDDCTREREWNKDEIVFLRTIATNLGTAIESHETDLKLKEAHDERSNILESIGDAFFAVDKNWVVTYWNKEAEKVLGKKREDVMGFKFWDLFEDARNLKFYDEYHRAMETGKIVDFEEYYPATDSWYEVTAYPSEKGLSVYFRDVSMRKHAEEQIRLSSELFEKVTEATNDAIWDYDVKNNDLFWSQGFEKLFGYHPEKTRPSFELLLSLIHSEDQSRVGQKVQQFLNDPEAKNWHEEYRFKRSDGTYAYVIDRAVFLRDAQGNATRVVGAMTDITYRKEHEESLKELNEQLEKHAKDLEISNAELEQFAYIASHDLQEPLRMVTSFLNQLERKYNDKLDEKGQQYIYFAVDGARRMRQIILDLLEYSRVGRMEEDVVTFDLNELIDGYRVLRKTTIEEKSAVIKAHNLPKINCYKTPVTQIFHNLIDNGIKYTRDGVAPEVNINVTEKDRFWEFSVCDNGIGINEEYHEKIFVIFQRLHDKSEYSGTGMGLAIVKKIIENMGGKIWLESKPDSGSCFYFTLPKNY